MSSKEYVVNWNIEEPVSVKGKTTLVFENDKKSELKFYVYDNEFRCENDDSVIKLYDFNKIKYIKTKEDVSTYSSFNIIDEMMVYNLVEYDTPVKNKVLTTIYNDTVSLGDFTIYDADGNPVDDHDKKTKGISITTYDGLDEITPTQYADTINAGNGTDIIYSSLGNDKITGGKGENKIVYSGAFDTDTVVLTKTENLTLDLTSYGFTKLSDLAFSVTSKDLDIIVAKDGFMYGTIKLKNFKKSNVVGASGKVLLDIGLLEPFDLNVVDNLYYDKTYFSKNGSFTGSRLSETIDASGVDEAYGKNNKGVTIKAGAGYNTILGTDGFNDTITGGNDGNDIAVGAGNNKITTGSGIDLIEIVGAGKNTVKTGKGCDEISLSGVTSADIYAGADSNTITIDNSSDFGNIVLKEEKVYANNKIIFTDEGIISSENYSIAKQGNNLIISSSDGSSSVNVNAYFLYTAGKKYAKNTFYIGENPLMIDDFISTLGGLNINGSGTIKGTEYDDNITANDASSTKAKNDKIVPNKGNDIINAGKGKNSIYLYIGDGQKIIVDGGGVDTLVFPAGTDLEYYYNAEDDIFVINYGGEEDNVLLKDFSESASVKYVSVGGKKTPLPSNFVVLQKGDDLCDLTLNSSELVTVILNHTFNGEPMIYDIKSNADECEVKLEFLENGRLYINGDNLEITARNGQKDDLIIMGSDNKIYTGDCDDILRIGYVVDARGAVTEFVQQSDNNIINTGSGDDYIEYFGRDNITDAGEGYDKVYVYANNAVLEDENITNAETVRMTVTTLPVNNEINWYNQGELGGDCRLFALLDSLSKSKDFSLDDYVEIIDNLNDTYTVTFKNYDKDNNSTTVALSDLSDFKNVYGDLDVILVDYAINQLIAINKDFGLDTFKKAYYNTVAEYFFGLGEKMAEVGESTGDITVTNYDNANYDERLFELWNMYQKGDITNITVGIQPKTVYEDDSDYKLGILTGHAYSIKELTEDYITLINPWDNADSLTLDYDFFKNLDSCIVVYGLDYYSEFMLVDNGYTRKQTGDFDSYISDIAADTANWNAVDAFASTGSCYADDDNIQVLNQVLSTDNLLNQI